MENKPYLQRPLIMTKKRGAKRKYLAADRDSGPTTFDAFTDVRRPKKRRKLLCVLVPSLPDDWRLPYSSPSDTAIPRLDPDPNAVLVCKSHEVYAVGEYRCGHVVHPLPSVHPHHPLHWLIIYSCALLPWFGIAFHRGLKAFICPTHELLVPLGELTTHILRNHHNLLQRTILISEDQKSTVALPDVRHTKKLMDHFVQHIAEAFNVPVTKSWNEDFRATAPIPYLSPPRRALRCPDCSHIITSSLSPKGVEKVIAPRSDHIKQRHGRRTTSSDRHPDPNEYFYAQVSGPSCGGKRLHSKIVLHGYTPPPQSGPAYQCVQVLPSLKPSTVGVSTPTPVYAEWLEQLGYPSMLQHALKGLSQNELFSLVILPSLYETRSPPLPNEVLVENALRHIYLFLTTFIKDANRYLDSAHPQLRDEIGTPSSQFRNLKYPSAYAGIVMGLFILLLRATVLKKAGMPLPFKLKLDPQERKATKRLYRYITESGNDLDLGTLHQKTYNLLKAVLMAQPSIEKRWSTAIDYVLFFGAFRRRRTGMLEGDSPFASPGQFTGVCASWQYVLRCIAVHIVRLGDNSVIVEEEDEGNFEDDDDDKDIGKLRADPVPSMLQSLKVFIAHNRSDDTVEQSTSFSRVRVAWHAAHVGKLQCPPPTQSVWEPNGHSFTLHRKARTIEVDVNRFKDGTWSLVKSVHRVLEKLMLDDPESIDLVMTFDVLGLEDNPCVPVSFIASITSRSATASIVEVIWEKLQAYVFHDGPKRIDGSRVRDWLRLEEELVGVLVTLHAITGGINPRSQQIAQLEFNSSIADHDRHLFLLNRDLVVAFSPSKNPRKQGEKSGSVHFLPSVVAQLLIVFLIFVRPLKTRLLMARGSVKLPGFLQTRIYLDTHGYPYSGAQLDNIIRDHLGKHFGMYANTLDLRQIFSSIKNKYFGGLFLVPEQSAVHAQADHSGYVDRSHYGRNFTRSKFSLSTEDIEHFYRLSRLFHGVMGLIPLEPEMSALRSPVPVLIRREREQLAAERCHRLVLYHYRLAVGENSDVMLSRIMELIEQKPYLGNYHDKHWSRLGDPVLHGVTSAVCRGASKARSGDVDPFHAASTQDIACAIAIIELTLLEFKAMAETGSDSFNSIDLDSLTYHTAVKGAEEEISRFQEWNLETVRSPSF
ncbi:uncharacterized protein EV420DRAFT_1165251 [Desarmillaria tabescens]|uniref:Uncharacterized protein n=1 Tax=Armillaria tabescens TaxID=1929756 RepID=A0AA39ND35_ARMTA|nr:uncharacterized protein EV420DRAFT_1165251 [Desarmillaria tabescens]KAK0463283.1 hypothetical protein EV420DRAFT_1165251 [Desarmillaria tabescens]